MMISTVAELIKEAREKYGNKVAYVDFKNSLSFTEIDHYSRLISQEVIKQGYFEVPILVISERNTFTPVTYLGIARAGCYYVPIDSTLNRSRIAQIINAVDSSLCFANKSFLPMLMEMGFHKQIICIEDILNNEEDEAIEVDKTENRIISSMPLYVIFTSGSTGKPKGVITSHLSLINYIEAVNDVLKMSSDDIMGNQSPLDYIAAIRDIYLPLMTGASMVIIPKSEFAMASELLATLNKYKISVICWSAAGLELCVKIRLFEEGTPKFIKKVLFSGSVLPGKVLKTWQQYLPDAVFINQYGPTETTASCTYYVVNEKATDNTILPIGCPYKNYKIVLLNDDKETLAGDIGEICVSGLGVAIGYYGNFELTEKTFIQNPLNKRFREIIYKTGDLGRINSNGLLEFCGRKDRQIKLMGHRVELEEIELAAKKISGIGNCAAVFDDANEILCLIYTGEAIKKDIVVYFRESMPAFMVPRRILHMDKLLFLPNGKVDYNGLKNYIKSPANKSQE